MESLLAIGVGLVVRVIMDIATDNDDRVGGVLVGLWEGVVLSHFIRRMPGSFDPYLGFAFRIFVDFLFTQSLSRLALVALWSLVGVLLADISPNLWRDSGLRHLYRQVRRDVRHVKRAVPRIRVENDLPSIRLFNKSKSRSASSGVSRSIRSDRASRAPSPATVPGPPRRQTPCPPGTLPDVSGWSETDTSISYQRERVVITPGPSPALIPLREPMTYEHADATQITTSQTRTTTVHDTTVMVTKTQHEPALVETVVERTVLDTAAEVREKAHAPTDDPSRLNPSTIPDDWVDVNNPPSTHPNEPVAPFRPDPASTPEPQPGPSSLTPSRPASVLDPPPAVNALRDISDVDAGSRVSRLPDQVPLPESRAASVIGGVFDQPQPRHSLCDSLRSRADKAASEIGVPPAKSLAPPLVTTQSTRSRSASRSWAGFAASFTRSKFSQSVDTDAPKTTPLEVTQEESASQSKPDIGGTVLGSETQTCTPAQVDPPASILTQPRDATPLLLASVMPEAEQQGQSRAQPVLSPADVVGADSSPDPPQGEKDKGDSTEARKSKASLFDVPSLPRSPPPPFSEVAGVADGSAAGEAPPEPDPVPQDDAPTKLTAEQSAAEENRIAFLLTQVQELDRSRRDLQKKLEKEDDPSGSLAKSIKSDLEDVEKSLAAVNARIARKKFSEPPPNPSIQEISLANQSAMEVQFTLTSAILDMLLERNDAGPMTIRATINRAKSLKLKAKEAKEALSVLVNRHKFAMHFENATPGIVNITF